jgi:hypothetical protein
MAALHSFRWWRRCTLFDGDGGVNSSLVAARRSSCRFIVGVFLLFLLLTKCPRELLRLICCGFFDDFCDSAFGNASYFDRTTQQSNRCVNTVVFVVDALVGCIELFSRATASVRHGGVDRDHGKSNSNL